jgi:mono/diheme cytochrome c family protein
MRAFLAGLLFGALLAVALPLVALRRGLIDMAADVEPGIVEETIGEWAYEGWLRRSAPVLRNPVTTNADVLSEGLSHYRENCVACHAAPGVEAAEIAKGLHPGAPALDEEEVQERTDGELFWTIKKGVRMTGMPAFGPTHADEELWKIVAFVRHLPELTAAEKAELREATEEEEGHHHHHGDPAG